jgi:AcrR family transcriptional regulator
MTASISENLEPAEELRVRILEAAASAFSDNGVRMKMEDVSRALAISKKTIYTVFPDKESLLSALIQESFNRIKASENELIANNQLSTLEKIHRVIIALPESLLKVDYQHFHQVSIRYPKLFKAIQARIEGEWEPTIKLLDQAVAEGVIRPMPVTVLKLMIEASIEHFLDSEVLTQEGIPYTEALEMMMDILLYGMRTT